MSVSMYIKLKAFFQTVAKFLRLRRRHKAGATYERSIGPVSYSLGEDEFYDSEYEEGESTYNFSPRPDLLDFESYSSEEDSLLFEPVPGVYFLHLNLGASGG
ncbi:hypothetical protein D9619_000062 [Psilocybe cf. subviscida]|uniref:Uncharacterized protein n=1 Tax=Psilocybe cf. subviscida TaxID=2480587 RepID=A0A8H5BGM3_9AGAR|nr:hypothetical protein D9619_000062 [Psilocybe cf. subviscida]